MKVTQQWEEFVVLAGDYTRKQVPKFLHVCSMHFVLRIFCMTLTVGVVIERGWNKVLPERLL